MSTNCVKYVTKVVKVTHIYHFLSQFAHRCQSGTTYILRTGEIDPAAADFSSPYFEYRDVN